MRNNLIASSEVTTFKYFFQNYFHAVRKRLVTFKWHNSQIFVSRAYAGIVGFVDVPYLVLEPTHNKQDFADAKV